MAISAINLLLDEALPEGLRDPHRIYDAKGVNALMSEVAKRHPELYPKLTKLLGDVGRKQAWRRGETFRMHDFNPVADRNALWQELDARESEVAGIEDPKTRAEARGDLYEEMSSRLQKETNTAALAAKNNIAMSVLSGARGKEAQLRDLIASPGFFPDGKGGVVPGFVRNSYAEGLRPYEFLSSSFSSRAAITESKKATAKGGFLAKTLARAMATEYVSAPDCGTSNGIDLPTDEKDIRGRILQRETAGYPAGTVIDRKVMSRLQQEKLDTVIVRSPLSCNAEHGVCGKCFGVKANGRFPKVGEHVGITASNALGEPMAQSALCLSVGTEVLMADFSTRKIELLAPGDWVMGADKEGNTFPVLVTALHDQGVQTCHSYGFAVGSTTQRLYLTATPAHKILANKKSSSAHLRKKYNGAYGYGGPDNYRAAIMPVGYPNKQFAAVLPASCRVEGLHEPLALMIGIFLGDGCRSPESGCPSPVFSCAEADLLEDLNTFLLPHDLACKKCKRSHDHNVTTPRLLGKRRARTNPLKTLLKKLECLHKYAHEKCIPAAVWGWDNESVAELIKGYLAADGSVYRHKAGNVGVGFGSVSRPLLEGVKLLLARRFGIYGGTINPGTKAGTNGYTHDAWTFVVSREDQVKKFAETFQNIPGRKGGLLRAYLAELPVRSARHPEPFVRALRKTAELVGPTQCYDITVEHEDHLFVLANGLIVSNSMKHVTSGKGKAREYSGLDFINQFVESPEEFKEKAAVSPVNGHVDAIRPAPQGGNYVVVGAHEVYVPLDREVTAKVGDALEAGDQLSDGLLDVEDVLAHRGLGEARRYWSDRMGAMAAASGAAMDRRLFETLAKSVVDHVELDDPEEEGFLPDDKVRYSRWLHRRNLPATPVETKLREATGKYLEQPALHYTVGTKLTPRMLDHLDKNGIPKVYVSDKEPSFRPTFVRLQQVAATDDDWLASLGGSYLGANLGQGVMRAQDTNILENIHPVPRLAVGVGYGDKLEETGKF